MNRPAHEQWADRLSELVDGELEGEELRGARAHLERCAACRTVAEELRSLARSARELGEVPPRRDLWPGIEARLRPRRLEPPAGVGKGSRGPAGRAGLFLSLPQLATAALLLVALSSLLTAAATRGPTPPAAPVDGPSAPLVPAEAVGAPPALADEVEALTRAVREGGARLDPETRRILEDNLAVIEGAIAEARRALVQDPANPFLEEHLERAWERKLAYLREAAGIVEWASS